MGDEFRFNSRFNGSSTLNGIARAPKGVDYTIARSEVSMDGFERFNIDDDDGIYIAKMPERALFNDGEPIIVKAQPGVFVGSRWNSKQIKVVKSEPKKSTDPKLLFSDILSNNKEVEIRTHVGTYDDGKVVEQKPITDFVSNMNNRIDAVMKQHQANYSVTSSASNEKNIHPQAQGFNTDNVQVKPLEKPRTQRKFSFVNGKLVQVEVTEGQVPSKPSADSTTSGN